MGLLPMLIRMAVSVAINISLMWYCDRIGGIGETARDVSGNTRFISTAGLGLSVTQRQTLEAAKGELRKLFGKDKTTRTAGALSCGAVQIAGGSGHPTPGPLPGPQSSPRR